MEVPGSSEGLGLAPGTVADLMQRKCYFLAMYEATSALACPWPS